MNKKGEIMKQKRISFGQGKGSLTHNNREFVADNVDPPVLRAEHHLRAVSR